MEKGGLLRVRNIRTVTTHAFRNTIDARRYTAKLRKALSVALKKGFVTGAKIGRKREKEDGEREEGRKGDCVRVACAPRVLHIWLRGGAVRVLRLLHTRLKIPLTHADTPQSCARHSPLG